ncbi:hypothetical protein IV203_019697 [Nitzschia inconspicua]|uniref:Uncharacterized protein n=1 Tax=Nitzschia inconspicua TaxID=303405 RepID=A0A9K3Q4J7_9STRA|nr:hypothetical protein IV203_019697 [Nitzschia inconspicua]
MAAAVFHKIEEAASIFYRNMKSRVTFAPRNVCGSRMYDKTQSINVPMKNNTIPDTYIKVVKLLSNGEGFLGHLNASNWTIPLIKYKIQVHCQHCNFVVGCEPRTYHRDLQIGSIVHSRVFVLKNVVEDSAIYFTNGSHAKCRDQVQSSWN